METQLATKDFKEMLKVMDKIKNKETNPATDLLVTSKDDTSQFIKSDSQTTIIYSLFTYIKENGTIILPVETAEMIKKLKEDRLTFVDNKIKTEKKEISFTEKDPITINTYENIEKIFSITQKELLRMLEVTYAVAQDDYRPILKGICFNKNETCALDGYRMSVRKSNQYKNSTTFVVNQSSIDILKLILKDTDDIVNVYHDMKDTVKFEINDITIIAKCLEGEFIKYSSIIPEGFSHEYKSTLNPEEMIDEIDFIRVADKRGFLKTTFTEDKIILKGNQCKKEYSEEKSYEDQEKRQKLLDKDYKNKHSKWLEKKNEAEIRNNKFKTKEPQCKNAKFTKMYDLIPVSDIISNVEAINKLNDKTEFLIAYNSKYMYEALKQYNDTVELQMNSETSPIVVTKDRDQGLELVLPVRISNK